MLDCVCLWNLDYLQQTLYHTPILFPISNSTIQTVKSIVQNSTLHDRLYVLLKMALVLAHM